MIHDTDPKCGWCKKSASDPGVNDRGELCPCRCHPNHGDDGLTDEEAAWAGDFLTELARGWE